MSNKTNSGSVSIPLSDISGLSKTQVGPSRFSIKSATHQPQWSNAERSLRRLLVDRLEGRWYVFDPENCNISIVSEPVALLLRDIKAGASVDEATLVGLVEELNLGDFVPGEPARVSWGIKVHLNHACNLACEYCYADGRTSDGDGEAKGAYGGKVSYMRQGVLEAAVTKFLGEAPGEWATIIFFGGEPLLSERRFLDAVKCANEAADKFNMHIDFGMTTNGTLLTNRILECLVDNKFRVAVSIDGTRDTHNHQRPMHGGGESYDRVVKGIELLHEFGIPTAARMTAFRGRGGIEKDHFALSELPVDATTFQFSHYGDDALRSLSEDERSSLLNHYRNVATLALAGDERATRLGRITEVLKGIMLRSKKEFQCGAGRWFWAVDTEGDVFPCHRFVGMSPFKVGSVLSQGFHFQALPLFAGNGVSQRIVREDGNQNCAMCFAHHVCGGGCAQIAAANNGRIDELPPFYCQETRLLVQGSVEALLEAMSGTAQARHSNTSGSGQLTSSS